MRNQRSITLWRKQMVPSAFQASPKPRGASARTCGGRGSLDPVELAGSKVADRPAVGRPERKFGPVGSHDRCASILSSDRSHSRRGPSPDATKTMRRPSGDRAKLERRGCQGV